MQCRQQPRNGVILHAGAIGDCLLTLPLAEFIKKYYGLQRLEFIGPKEYVDFFPQRTCVDAVISIDGTDLHQLFKEPAAFETSYHGRLLNLFSRYEQIVSFLGFENPNFERNLLFAVHSTHSAEVTLIPAKQPAFADKPMHLTDYYLNFFIQSQQIETDLKPDPRTLFPLPEDFDAGADILNTAGIEPDQAVVVIHPGSGSREKCWHWKNFLQTAHDLKSNKIQPVFLLGPAEKERFENTIIRKISRFPVLDNLSLTEILQVLAQADAFLGNDSGITHIAAGMGKKTLAVFGPSNPVHYAPRGENVIIEQLSDKTFRHFSSDAQTGLLKTLLELL